MVPVRTVPSGVSGGGMLIIAAAVVGVIGALGPWVTAGALSRAGTEVDGQITIVIAGILAIVACVRARQPTSGFAIGAMVAGAALAVIGVIDVADVNDKASDADLEGIVRVGWGLYLTVGAGIAAVVGGALVKNEAED